MSDNRREHQRDLVRLKIRYGSPGEFEQAYTENLSLGGIFVATPRQIPIGTRIEVVIEVRENQGFRVVAEVKWQRTASFKEPGLGLEFVEMLPKHQVWLEGVLQKARLRDSLAKKKRQVQAEQDDRIRVIAKYRTGHMIRGFVENFNPDRTECNIQLVDEPDQRALVHLDELKAVFFVKTFEGDPHYKERKTFKRGDDTAGRRVRIKFYDGEAMAGTTSTLNRDRIGFFITPADDKSNNRKVFVIFTATTSIEFGSE